MKKKSSIFLTQKPEKRREQKCLNEIFDVKIEIGYVIIKKYHLTRKNRRAQSRYRANIKFEEQIIIKRRRRIARNNSPL